jgi:hypothetical protein
MKKYLVAYWILSLHLEEQFDDKDDAIALAEIMNRRYPGRDYSVYEKIENSKEDK